MKDITPKSFTQSMKEFLQSLEAAVRQVVRGIGAAPWSVLLTCAIAVALILSMLPLVIFVFAVFLLVKVAVAAFSKPRQLPAPPQPPEGQ